VTDGPSDTALRHLSSLFDAGTASGLRDCELLERFIARRGPKDDAAEIAFATLVERHGPMVLRTCRAVLTDHHQAEDAFQATFLVLASCPMDSCFQARTNPHGLGCGSAQLVCA
jgi:hypothetical protein